jgi:molybdenum cofactor cytidylyltransferase
MKTVPAIVPAAGKSRRMGQPKLLLPFDGQPLIGRVVRALREGGAEPVIIVAPPADAPEGPAVAEAARQAGAIVITPPRRPLEMRESAELALEWLDRDGPPPAVLLTPGDSPGITPGIVRRVLDRWADSDQSLIVPTAGGQHIHPIVLTWDVASLVSTLPRHLGINALVAKFSDRVIELELTDPDLVWDLNTPKDLARWREQAARRTEKRVVAMPASASSASRLTIRLFAVARQKAGKPEVEVELPSLPATVGDLRLALAMQHPALASLAPSVMIAVDSDYAADETMIISGAKLALIPPVSGGSGTTSEMHASRNGA